MLLFAHRYSDVRCGIASAREVGVPAATLGL